MDTKIITGHCQRHRMCFPMSVYQMCIWYTDIGKHILQSMYVLSDSNLWAQTFNYVCVNDTVLYISTCCTGGIQKLFGLISCAAIL